MSQETPSEQGSNKAFIDNQWKPGQSGNPGGRPKDKGITIVQTEMLDKPCKYDTKLTWREYLALKGLEQAVSKERALEYLKERLEGKVPDTHRIEGDVPVIIQPVVYEGREDATKQGEKQGENEES